MLKIVSLVALVAHLVSGSTVHRRHIPLAPSGRIFGGEDTTIEEVPYQVSIRVLKNHICGGSILSENWVITAGGCADWQTYFYRVHAGSTHRTENGTSHLVDYIIRPMNYGNNSNGVPTYDIALLHLAQPLVLDEKRQPIELFKAGEEAEVDAVAVITGWGATDGRALSTILQTVDVPIVSKEYCSNAYESYGGLPERQICAGSSNGGKGHCRGDRGGPLAIAGRLAGIASWGNDCAVDGQPGVYTEVSAYHDWIKANTEI